MKQLTRITLNPEVMGGKPCIRGMRVTVGTVVGLVASGHTLNQILEAYSYLEEADIYEALAYAAWRTEEDDNVMTVTTMKWTIEDYHRMLEVGLLEERHVELLNGEIFEMPPEGPEHAYLGDETGKYLSNLLGERARVREGRPITLSHNSEPEPELAIVRPLGQIYRQRHPGAEDIFWLIEFSHTSLAKDLDTKRQAYATAEIQEYWVVDLKHRQLNVFQEPINGNYGWEMSFTTGEIRPLAFPDIIVSVQRLLEG